MAFKVIDNRPDSVPSGGDIAQYQTFGLGSDSQGAPIGYYTILQKYGSTAIVDGNTGYIKISGDGGNNWSTPANQVMFYSYNKRSIIQAYSASNNNSHEPITNASIELQVVPTIQPLNTLDTSEIINIDGSATIELIYL
ncbi:hypothetical protein D3C75_575520 [compost metagenome]